MEQLNKTNFNVVTKLEFFKIIIYPTRLHARLTFAGYDCKSLILFFNNNKADGITFCVYVLYGFDKC